MANTIQFKTSKRTSAPKAPKAAQYILPCRRCGPDCSCSEEEIDAGGPA